MNDSRRIYLKEGQSIYLSVKQDGSMPDRYEIQEVIGEGGSTICYRAIRNRDGHIQSGKLKEFYPVNAVQGGRIWYYALERLENGQLVPCSGTTPKFAEMCDAYLKNYHMLKEYETASAYNQILSNYIQDGEPLYGCSGEEKRQATVYIWSVGAEGKGFDSYLADVRKHPALHADTVLHDIIRIVRTLTDCISAMHTAGLMHLDIKPSNFLMNYNSTMEINPEQISLFDINTLQAVGNSLPVCGGSLGYTAPELLKGKADNRSDIYSIGAMLFYALVVNDKIENGLFQNEYYKNLANLVKHSKLIQNADARYDAKLLSVLAKIMKKCLAQNPSGRYASCTPLLQDLETAELLAKQYAISVSLGMNRQYRLTETTEKGLTDPVIVMQKLLYEHPLYETMPTRNGIIRVLVIGAGNYSQKFIDTALQAAQMKDCELKIAVLSASPEEDRDCYLEFRSELPRFVEVSKNLKELEQSGNPEKYGKICFCSLAEAAGKNQTDNLLFRKKEKEKNRELTLDIISHCKDTLQYVFIAVGDDNLNYTIAVQFAELLEQFNTLCPVCYVSEKNKKTSEKKKLYPVCINEAITPETITPQLEQMAFNTHISWKGTLNLNLQEEYQKFCKNAYNYSSSLAFVLSVKYKLHSIGIDGDHYEMAEKFQAVLDQRTADPNADDAFRILTNLEHRRWVLEKVTDGWKAPRDAEGRLYLQSCVTKKMVKNELECTHPCIVTSTEAMPLSSELYQKDGRKKWDDPDIDISLDELDTMSVMLYQCFRAEAENVKAMNPLKSEDMKVLADIIKDTDETVIRAYKQFEFCIKNILNSVESYTRQYDSYEENFKKEMHHLPKETQQKAEKRLELIRQMLFPVMEANLHRNYKLYDVVLIEKIPFILTYQFINSIGCVFNDGLWNNGCNESVFPSVASATVLCPKHLLYVYCFTPDSSPQLLSEKMNNVINYLQRRNIKSNICLAVACEKEVSAKKRELLDGYLKNLPIESCILDAANNTESAELLAEYLLQKKIQMFDGSSSLFISQYANHYFLNLLQKNEIAYFEFDWRHKKFRNCRGNSHYLQYIQDTSHITVDDMFALMNAKNIRFHFPEYGDDYEKLWNIYTGSYLSFNQFEYGVGNWNKLCEFLSDYNKKQGIITAIPFKEQKEPKVLELTYYLPEYTRKTVQKLTKQMKEAHLIHENSEVTGHASDTCCLKWIVPKTSQQQIETIFRNPAILQEYYMPAVYRTSEEFMIRYETMEVKNAVFGKNEQDAKYSFQVLGHLEKDGFIRQLRQDEHDKRLGSFVYSSPRIKSVLTKAGEILEIYTYYEVLKEGFFDSVACGYQFSWEKGDVFNELDLVLTKGFSSVIVECKAVLQLEQDYYHKLNSIAEHFGIGIHKVLIGNVYKNFYEEVNKMQCSRGIQLHVQTYHKKEDIIHIGEKLRKIIEA